jgi:ssDNA-binding Zn-finger/Zn-ribbon topoisomerase 1
MENNIMSLSLSINNDWELGYNTITVEREGGQYVGVLSAFLKKDTAPISKLTINDISINKKYINTAHETPVYSFRGRYLRTDIRYSRHTEVEIDIDATFLLSDGRSVKVTLNDPKKLDYVSTIVDESINRFICSECESIMLRRTTKSGKEFYGCSAYPDCSYTVNPSTNKSKHQYDPDAPICSECGAPMVKRAGKSGSEFYGCSRYPKCGHTFNPSASIKAKKPVETEAVPPCDKCGATMVKRVAKSGKNEGKEFYGCSNYPDCKNMISDSDKPKKYSGSAPTNTSSKSSRAEVDAPTCPKCGSPMVRRTAKSGQNAGNEFYGCSKFPECKGIVSIPKDN